MRPLKAASMEVPFKTEGDALQRTQTLNCDTACASSSPCHHCPLQWARRAAAMLVATPPAGSTARPSSGPTPRPPCHRSTPSSSTVRATARSCSTVSTTSPSPTPSGAPSTVSSASSLLLSHHFPFHPLLPPCSPPPHFLPTFLFLSCLVSKLTHCFSFPLFSFSFVLLFLSIYSYFLSPDVRTSVVQNIWLLK